MTARLKEIQVELGTSVELKVGNKSSWVRPTCRVAVAIDEPLTREAKERVFKQAWEMVTEQINNVIQETVNEE